MSIKDVTDSTFVDETKEGFVIAELGAAWCAPCKMIAPALQEINEDQHNNISVIQVDIDDNQETAQKFGVMSIPTLLFFKDGELMEQTVGFQPKEEILATAQKHI
ncbi:thioredoxin [Planococcus donghaensis MPA1U2]|uniref:Thioredoxin n=1 Tax=Planococcus donghaensis MPA1U2 TaxID=933115 RepID=E7RGP9_9BACL|nr:thioredoxin [Planococcus donghaensis]EGA89782.1 thioredoxin [Planococcus donghaensis MPA1U2]